MQPQASLVQVSLDPKCPHMSKAQMPKPEVPHGPDSLDQGEVLVVFIKDIALQSFESSGGGAMSEHGHPWKEGVIVL